MFGVIEVGRNYYINCIHYNGPQQPINLKSLLLTVDYNSCKIYLATNRQPVGRDTDTSVCTFPLTYYRHIL